jgi:hypothetical protein
MVLCYIHRIMKPLLKYNLRTFLSLKKENIDPLTVIPTLVPNSWTPVTSNLLSSYIQYLFYIFHKIDPCNMFSFVSGFFHLFCCFQGSSILYYASVLHSLLLINNTPLYRYTTFCLSISHLDILTTFKYFWLLWIEMCVHLLQDFEGKNVSLFLDMYLGVTIVEHMATVCLIFCRNACFLKSLVLRKLF